MKKLNFLTQSLVAGLVCVSAVALTSCDNADNPTPDAPVVVVPNVPGIPSDGSATPNPVVLPEEINAVLPNFNYSVDKENGFLVIRFDMTGIQDPNNPNEWVRLYGPGDAQQNVWLEIDDKPKGFSIYNTIDGTSQQQAPVDLVFLVDNSSSMSEEANAIARDIIEWSKELSKTLDVRFGCVGYGGFVSGAINLTTAEKMETWLNKSTGIMRTRDFADETEEKAQALREAAAGTDYRVVGTGYKYTNKYDPDYYECGVVALRFANDKFSFRPGANRVYVNLTDEPNQPNGKNELFSTQWVKEKANWSSIQGTIHTVYTESASWANSYQQYIDKDYPWDLSLYTGGTMLFTNSNFRDANGKDVKLSDLPVSSALQNSYVIKFTNIEEIFDGQQHKVKITVKATGTDGAVIAEQTFYIVFQI